MFFKQISYRRLVTMIDILDNVKGLILIDESNDVKVLKEKLEQEEGLNFRQKRKLDDLITRYDEHYPFG